jgi:hypothetical protein
MREEPVVTRRATLRRCALAVGGVVGVAGCLETGVGDEPDPVVVRTEPADLTDVTENRAVEVTALIHNVGATGEIVVTVKTLAGVGQEAIETASTTLSMDSDTQREVTITIDVSAVADRLEATAEPAE